HPQITPILSSLIPQPEFYVLAVTKKLLKLGRWRDGVCTEVSMPAEVSTSFEDTLISERPDHDLQSHSPSGPSSQVGSTRFGTGSERESVHGRLRRYFQTVDQHLADFLNGAPLVLVGIEQELAAYRSEARYAHVLLAEPTSPAHLSFAELGRLGQAAVLQKQRADADKVLRDFRESVRRDHVVIGIREVLEAAYEGRVHKLLMERNARHDGLLGPLFPESLRLEGQQDLINAAAVETIKHHGEVYVIDAGELGSCPVAAILRFATPSGALHGNR
ncbi:MAG TPA: hypothetical protein VFQ91_06845, partial [Bryobacteraceae bacterium]|nr:hypothetical protein [Bryobacteraceae bacterium]